MGEGMVGVHIAAFDDEECQGGLVGVSLAILEEGGQAGEEVEVTDDDEAGYDEF